MKLSNIFAREHEPKLRFIEIMVIGIGTLFFSWQQWRIANKQTEHSEKQIEFSEKQIQFTEKQIALTEKELLIADKQFKLQLAATPPEVDVTYHATDPDVNIQARDVTVRFFREDINVQELQAIATVEQKGEYAKVLKIDNFFGVTEVKRNQWIFHVDPDLNDYLIAKKYHKRLDDKISQDQRQLDTKIYLRIGYINSMKEYHVSYVMLSNYYFNKVFVNETPFLAESIDVKDYYDKRTGKFDIEAIDAVVKNKFDLK